MNCCELKNWISKLIFAKARNSTITVWYILSLMIPARKHSLTHAAEISGHDKSQFSKFLKDKHGLALKTLAQLSKKQAKQFSKAMKLLSAGLTWKIAILVDSTLQKRWTRHTDNAKRFNHGSGFVIGHQWTNFVLLINGVVLPLNPIPFFSKRYCKKNGLEYKTEQDLVVEYIANLSLEDYVGDHKPEEVILLADSGYDNKMIENAIIRKKWKFIIALKSTRSIKTQKEHFITQKSKGWAQIAQFFKNHRRLKWQTIRIYTNGSKIKRKDFRIRQIIGYLRNVGKVQLICSEYKKRPDGRRKYLACNDLKATARQILMGYRLRWRIEIFHKEVKMHLGFEDVATSCFKSVMAHVHWVYCAYILLNFNPPGVSENLSGVMDKQHRVKEIVESRKISRIRQLLTQFNGAEKLRYELREALQPM